MYCDARQWRDIRRRILEQGVPKKRVSAETGISRRTINKMLAHEQPPGYRRRPSRYPKLAPHIHTIDRLLIDNDPFSLADNMTIQDIVRHLRREEGFVGSYDSVRNYIQRRAHDDEKAWGRAYDLIIHLPKPRALDVIRRLSRGRSPAFASAQLRSFVREPACPRTPSARSGRKGRRLLHIEWMRRVLQKESTEVTLHHELGDIPDLSILLRHLHNGGLSRRNPAMVVLASRRKIPSRTICAFLGVGKAFVRKYRDMFDSKGAELVFAPQTKSNRKIDNEDLRRAVFSLLHEPPFSHGINRTSWTMALLRRVLKENGTHVGTALVAKMIKAAGHKGRNAKIVFTSNDPTLQGEARSHSLYSFKPTARGGLLFD